MSKTSHPSLFRASPPIIMHCHTTYLTLSYFHLSKWLLSHSLFLSQSAPPIVPLFSNASIHAQTQSTLSQVKGRLHDFLPSTVRSCFSTWQQWRVDCAGAVLLRARLQHTGAPKSLLFCDMIAFPVHCSHIIPCSRRCYSDSLYKQTVLDSYIHSSHSCPLKWVQSICLGMTVYRDMASSSSVKMMMCVCVAWPEGKSREGGWMKGKGSEVREGGMLVE